MEKEKFDPETEVKISKVKIEEILKSLAYKEYVEWRKSSGKMHMAAAENFKRKFETLRDTMQGWIK
jgi:hypothetical protein